MSKLNHVIAAAIAEVEGLPRLRSAGKSYISDVINGRRCWSGADIQGKAKEYGGHYARQRKRAENILYAAGGKIVAVNHGLLVTAVDVGQDDYGNALHATTEGVAVQNTKNQARLI